MRGIVNIVIGLIMVGGGLSGGLVLRGSGSGSALAVVGAVLIVVGVVRLVGAAKRSGGAEPEEKREEPPPSDGPPVTRG